MNILRGAGLPPPPVLPLPPGLDSASAVPYQQKPIDLFKAIFEASDSEEEDEEEAAEKEVPEKGDAVLAGGEGRSLSTSDAAPAAQNIVRVAVQDTSRAGMTEQRTRIRKPCTLSLCVHQSGWGQRPGNCSPLKVG